MSFASPEMKDPGTSSRHQGLNPSSRADRSQRQEKAPSTSPSAGRPDWRQRQIIQLRLSRAERLRADQIIAVLAQLWPRCFRLDEEWRLPLKMGIGVDLKGMLTEPEPISERDIDLALIRYVGSRGYLRRSSHAGAVRIDLDGRKAGRVRKHQANRAKVLLLKRGRR
jgi:hypothetical protein